MTEFSSKLSFREKAGYAVGDASANFVFQILIVFQAGFYTDVMGISAAALAFSSMHGGATARTIAALMPLVPSVRTS